MTATEPGLDHPKPQEGRVLAYLLSVIQGRPGGAAALIRAALRILSLTYNAGLELYLLPYRSGLRKRHRLSRPVICVGNLSVGGTGKTPATILVCEWLKEAGIAPAVLTRGYRGEMEHGCGAVSDGAQMLLTAQEAGDEAFLLARRLPGVPVVAGKDRLRTGTLAIERFAPDAIVMDDGFQFWQLHRDLDVVLIDASDPFGTGWTLPAGLLREPPSHLVRAGAVLLTGADRCSPAALKPVEARLRQLAPRANVASAALVPSALEHLSGSERVDLAWLAGRRVSVVSAIGNPLAFEHTVSELGAVIVHRQHFPDHSGIPEAAWRDIALYARKSDAEAVIITEKDGVKAAPPPVSGIDILVLIVVMRVSGSESLRDLVVQHASTEPLPC